MFFHLDSVLSANFVNSIVYVISYPNAAVILRAFCIPLSPHVLIPHVPLLLPHASQA